LLFALFYLPAFSSALEFCSFPGCPLAFNSGLIPVSQLHPQPFVFGAKSLQLAFHALRAVTKLSKLGLHSILVHSENFSEGSAHLLGVSGDDLSDLPFHRIGAGHQSHALLRRAGAETRLVLGAANSLISPGLRAFPDLPRIPADVSFGGSSLAFGILFGTVARAPGLHASEPVVWALACKGDSKSLALPQLAGRHPEVFVLPRNKDRYVVVTFERLDHDAQVALLIDLLFDKPDKRPSHLAHCAAFLSGQHPAKCQRRQRDEHECLAQFFHGNSP
jgi:hypothetical protein